VGTFTGGVVTPAHIAAEYDGKDEQEHLTFQHGMGTTVKQASAQYQKQGSAGMILRILKELNIPYFNTGKRKRIEKRTKVLYMIKEDTWQNLQKLLMSVYKEIRPMMEEAALDIPDY
jgi:hypothetical protein